MSSLSFSNKVAMTASKNIPFQFFAECKLSEKITPNPPLLQQKYFKGAEPMEHILFSPMLHFYTTEIIRIPYSFLKFSVDVER